MTFDGIKPLSCAYVTTGSANDISQWSGLTSHIRDALLKQGLQVHTIDNLGSPNNSWLRWRGICYRKILHQSFHLDRHSGFARRLARQALNEIGLLNRIDWIVCPSTIPVAQLDCSIPIAIWTDATWHALLNFYPGYSDVCRKSVVSGHELEKRAMERARAVVFSSDWAAKDATDFYKIDPDKVHVVQYGANVESPFADEHQAMQAVWSRDRQTCNLLFVGIEWERKGGPLALQIVEMLNRNGCKSLLTIVGCDPFNGGVPPANVVVKGFLRKSVPDELEKLISLFLDSHFLLVPSVAECSAIVFAEAGAFAVPSLARRVGGVESAIQDGLNGRLFTLEEGPRPYVKFIRTAMAEPQLLLEMSLKSYKQYRTKLNWTEAGRGFRRILEKEVGTQ